MLVLPVPAVPETSIELPRKKVADVVGENQRGRSDGSGKPGEKRDPAGHESPSGSVGAREVDILSAGAGKVDAQLGVADCAGQCEQRSDEPGCQDELGAAQRRGHKSGGAEDRGPHHVRHHERRRAYQAELTKQAACFCRAGFRGYHYQPFY